MKKTFGHLGVLLSMLICLTGCNSIGDKSASLSIVYGVMAIISVLMLGAYCLLIRKKELWFLVLFVAVCVVNCGYFFLSVSKTLSMALLANRISYLGSVFLPLSMLMILLRTTGLRYKKWLVSILLGISFVVFLVAASPGILSIYYKEVWLGTAGGATILQKIYGPWHKLYLFYLLAYYGAILGALVHSLVKKKLKSTVHCVFLVIAVTVNVGVWLLEQLVRIEFEFLSVSYIMSEMFLLGLCYLMQMDAAKPVPVSVPTPELQPEEAQKQQFVTGLQALTKTEKAVLRLYLQGNGTKDVLTALDITENTLKYHNRNIYSKLGVSSRKELLALAKSCDIVNV